MSEALRMVLYLSVCGTALGCALMLTQALVGRRLTSRFYYFAWLIVLARFALPIPGLVSAQRTETASAQTVQVQSDAHLAALPQGQSDAQQGADATVSEEEAAPAYTAQSQALTLSDVAPEPATQSRGAHLSWPVCGWTALWAAGAAVSMLWYGVGYARFYRALRRTLRDADEQELALYAGLAGRSRARLAHSSAVETPMLLGLFRPLIVLPEGKWEAETLRLILLHELTHYRRGDIALKWLAACARSVHWFNPFMPLLGRRLDESCELSCDERLLRGMDRGQRRLYGQALLTMAESGTRGAAVVATTFATEKRTLKGRLEQIMKYKAKSAWVILPALAALVLLAACAVVIGPATQTQETAQSVEPTPSPMLWDEALAASGEVTGEVSGEAGTIAVDMPQGGETVTVSTVDELLAAIAPGNTIYLASGSYVLDEAADYATQYVGGCYTWREVADGWQLVIENVQGLTLVSPDGDAEIVTLPRYADVLAFENCADIAIEGVTIGHTEGAGGCSGSVLSFDGTTDVAVTLCSLYGCGTIGIEASSCERLEASETSIYECSQMAVDLTNCYDVCLTDCELYSCGEDAGYPVIDVLQCYGVAVVNSAIYENNGLELISAAYADEVYLLGCEVYGNSISEGVFGLSCADLIVAGCSFADCDGVDWVDASAQWGAVSGSASGAVYSLAGEKLSDAQLASMSLEAQTYDGPAAPTVPELNVQTSADGRRLVEVSTVDEFLAAIAPDTTIRLAAGEYDLSEASYYGVPLSSYYGWTASYDGPQLTISGVDGLTIEGAGAQETTILSLPRGAEVLTFYNCELLAVHGITAGHVELGNTCGAGVLGLEQCSQVEVSECGLFGCGTRGVSVRECTDVRVYATEIYDCSIDAAGVTGSENVSFDECIIRDCASNEIVVRESSNVTRDGEAL